MRLYFVVKYHGGEQEFKTQKVAAQYAKCVNGYVVMRKGKARR